MYDLKCSSCQTVISSDVNICPQCGQNLEAQKSSIALLLAIHEEVRRLKSKKEIKKIMIERGWPEEEVIKCFENLESSEKAIMADPAGRKEVRQRQVRISLQLLKYGLPFLFCGVIASFFLKDIGIIWVGAFIVGIPLSIIGIFGYLWCTFLLKIGK